MRRRTLGTATPFFGDPHTDSAMRTLIARFAYLGCAMVAVTAPFVAPDRRALVTVLVNVSVAALVTFVAQRTGLLDRAGNRFIGVLLVMYGGFIAVGSGAVDTEVSPYHYLQLLPVIFGAIFFVGPDRYLSPAAVWLVEHVVLSLYDPVPWRLAVTRLGFYLLVAHFGAQLAGLLRDALSSNRALHTVLEKASGDPMAPELASTGLKAALLVSGWDAGGVVLLDGDELPVVALSGFGEFYDEIQTFYDSNPLRVGDGSMAGRCILTREVQWTVDAPAEKGPDHPLTRAGILSIAGLPICYHGEPIGVLLLSSPEVRRLDGRERSRLLHVAEQLGLALGNAGAHRREAQVSERLRDLNRRKDDFLANVSHELRTPATTIRMAARTLLVADERLTADERREIHERLARRAGQLCELIESLLEESVAESSGVRLRPELVEWTGALRRWVSIVEDQTGRHISIRTPDGAVSSLADPAKAERVVSNLLLNAAKFSPDHTTIGIELQADPDEITIRVHDSGKGIDPAALPHIFDRFYQADSGSTRESGGVGIGLSLARGFVEAHGGRITVESQLGTGTTFTVVLPRERPEGAHTAELPSMRSVRSLLR